MVPVLTTAQATEEAFCAVRASFTVAVGKLMVDPLDHVVVVQPPQPFAMADKS